MDQLLLTQEHWDAMRAHVESCRPLEGCGLLAGRGDAVQQVLQIANQARSPARYRMDPVEQIRAFSQMEADGLDLVGIYHSHPAGPEAISATDIAEAAYPVVHVIWSRPHGTWQARGYWIENGRALEVELRLTGSEPAA